MKTRTLKNYLKAGILTLGLPLFLTNCEEETISEQDVVNIETKNSKIDAITVSFEDAISYFKTNDSSSSSSRGIDPIVLSPDWKTLDQQELFNTDALVTNAKTSINRTGNFSSELFFIRVNDTIKNVIYTIYKDSIDSDGNIVNARFFINELNGDYVDGYKVENGNTVKRYLYNRSESNSSSTGRLERDTDPEDCWNTDNLPDGDHTFDTVYLCGSSGGSNSSSGSFSGSWSGFTGSTRGSVSTTGGYASESASGGGSNGSATGSSIGSDTGRLTARELKELAGAIVVEPIPTPDEDDDQIINNLTGKALCLNDNLTKNGNTFVKDLLANFKGISEFDINIKSVDEIYSKEMKKYVNGVTTYKNGSKVINIEISTDKILNRPVLAGIRTILHEYIHADMFRKLNTKDSSTAEVKSFKETYEKYENEGHHNSMAELYVNSMKNTLKEVHKKILLGEYNYLSSNGTNSLDNLYEALAWQGLKNHKLKAWRDLGKDTIRINDALEKDFYSLTFNCPK